VYRIGNPGLISQKQYGRQAKRCTIALGGFVELARVTRQYIYGLAGHLTLKLIYEQGTLPEEKRLR
jgi:hypothetical protein